MFNPWFSFTVQAARLGFEAQSAMAHRFMGLLGDAGKTEIPGMIAREIAAAPDVRATADELDIVATADRAVSAGPVVGPSPRLTRSRCARANAGAPSKTGNRSEKFPTRSRGAMDGGCKHHFIGPAGRVKSCGGG